MAFAFGPDFIAARQGELYAARTGQPLWFAALMVVAMFAVLSLLQTIVGFFFVPVLNAFSNAGVAGSDTDALRNLMVKATIVGLLPSSLIAAFAALKFSKVRNAGGDTGVPLHVPALGMPGWLLVVAGLIVVMWAAFVLTFIVLGIDPATYAANKDPNSSAGMVEKAMADLADEPFLFALALPGVTLGVAVVEEIIFRGAIFSALRHSWFGKTGAVVITSAAWAVVHAMAAPWLFVFIIFVMGLALGWLLLRFGSLTVTIVCHACWNLFSSLVIFGGQVPS
jgi:uncharacterized protein